MKWRKCGPNLWLLETRFFVLKIMKDQGFWKAYNPWTGWMELPGSMTLGEVMRSVQSQMAAEFKMAAEKLGQEVKLVAV